MNHLVAMLFSMLFVPFLSTSHAAESFNYPETVSPEQLPVQAIVVTQNNHVYAGTFGGGVYRSIDDGATWVDRNTGLPDKDVLAVDVDARGAIFVGTFGGGIYRSSNEESRWKHVSDGLGCGEIVSLKIGPENDLYAGTSNGGVYYSADDCKTWIALGLSGKYVSSIAITSRTEIFAGTSDGIYASIDRGKTWSLRNSGLRCRDVWALAVHQNGDLFAATNGGGVFRSTDNGATWVTANVGLSSMDAGSLAICSDGNIFVGTTAGVFISKDNGVSWGRVLGDIADGTVRCLTVGRNGQVLTGMLKGSVLRSKSLRPLPEEISDLYEEY